MSKIWSPGITGKDLHSKDQLPPIDIIENPPNRNRNWYLQNIASPKGYFKDKVDDVNFIYRLSAMPAQYSYNWWTGSESIESLAINNVVVALRLNKLSNQLFLTMACDFWCTNRTQRPFPYIHFQILDKNDLLLALVPMEATQTFVINCQSNSKPGSSWQSNAIAIGGPVTEYFSSASHVQLIFPTELGGDHGPLCH